MKYLIVGLGNPGPEYELTRHNIGFLILDRLVDQGKGIFSSARYGEKAEIRFKGKQIHLVKPNTFMNLSGKAVSYWLQDLKIPTEHLLVVLDDIALPFAHLRMKPRGSSAGHNGLNHIEETLGNQNYARLRFGIGNDYPKGRQADYVLSNFNDAELKQLPEAMDKASEMILSFCTAGIERTMNQFNQ
ncbi:MAG: aminoacyl-tRNA hydrolase [Bacteroidetes bacterium]|nr:aminoacyl-tRNA hydrolase [Bacteroidota bacterium]